MWLINCLLCHNLIYWMLSLILVLIAGQWPGHFTVSRLPYECKPLPALEFKFTSCPKCFITPSYLSIRSNFRTGKEYVNKASISTACQCWSLYLILHVGNIIRFVLEDVCCLLEHTCKPGIKGWIRDHVWASFPGCVISWVWVKPFNQIISRCKISGHLTPVGSHQGWGGVRLCHRLSLSLTLQKTQQHLRVSAQSNGVWVRLPSSY